MRDKFRGRDFLSLMDFTWESIKDFSWTTPLDIKSIKMIINDYIGRPDS